MKINEISAASSIPEIKWTEELINQSEHFSDIEGHEIFSLKIGNEIHFLILDQNKEVASYISVLDEKINGFYPLKRIVNTKRIPGLATTLIIGLIAKGLKFVIASDETLTKFGLLWLIKLIKTGAGLKVVDQNGNIPNIDDLQSEWKKAAWGTSGPTELFIENKTISFEKIFEDNKKWKSSIGLLKPMYKWFTHNDLL